MLAAAVLSVVLLLLNGAFVALEFALVGARYSRLEPMAAQGRRSAVLAVAAMRRLNMQLAGAQLGITLASLSLGYVAEPLVVHALEDLLALGPIPPTLGRVVSLVLGLAFVVFIHMVVGEMVPKNLAITAPERTLLVLARPNLWYLRLLGPVVWLLNAVALAGVRLLRITPRDELESAPSADDLARMLAESHRLGLIEGDAHRLLTGVLDFGGRTAATVMVPRPSIQSVTTSTTLADAEALIASSGHSRLPVFDDSSGEPLGFVHAKDLFALSGSVGGLPIPMRLVRRMPLVPCDRPLEELLGVMRRTGVHVALVIDDAGAVDGLVTLEDLLEELVGEIIDETDVDPAHSSGSGSQQGG